MEIYSPCKRRPPQTANEMLCGVDPALWISNAYSLFLACMDIWTTMKTKRAWAMKVTRVGRERPFFRHWLKPEPGFGFIAPGHFGVWCYFTIF